MNSPPHKAVGLERYPSFPLFTPARPTNLRLHSLPSISEQSSGVIVDEDLPMFPRSITPSPSPPPWKVLFQRAKDREQPKQEREYFSSRPCHATPMPRWIDCAYVSSPEEVELSEGDSNDDQPTFDTCMDMEMDVSDERSELVYPISEQKAKTEILTWESPVYHPRVETHLDHFVLPPPVVFFDNKRKRGYEVDAEEEAEETCRRNIKRPMATYHRNHLHALLQAV